MKSFEFQLTFTFVTFVSTHLLLASLYQFLTFIQHISFNIHSTERHYSVVFNIRELKFHLWEGYKFNRMGVGGKGTANCLFTKNRKKK